jgi:hypothetical protein
LDDVLQNQFLVVGMIFLHNLLVISLILLDMMFYVNLVVLNFLMQEKHADVIITHPRSYVTVLACMVIFLSILRGAALTNGGVALETLLLISGPVGIVGGYGIYLTIRKTLDRTMSMSGLSYIYGVFFAASIMEVGFINLMITFAT